MWVQTEEYKVIGAALGDARKAAGFNQQELAARLSKPQSFISSYERGQRRVDLLEFITIVSALEADPVQIFRRIVRAYSPPKKALRKIPRPGPR